LLNGLKDFFEDGWCGVTAADAHPSPAYESTPLLLLQVLQDLWAELKLKEVPAYEFPLRAIIEEKDMIRTATGKHKKRSDVEKDKRYVYYVVPILSKIVR
jgi:hypothetical protein